MFRKYVIVTLAAVFFLGASGCTSKKAEEDKAEVESSSTDGMETAEATENNSDLDTSTAMADAPKEGDGLSDATASTETAGGDDLAASTEAPADQAAVAPGDISETPPADIPPAEAVAAESVAAGDATATPPPGEPEMAPPAAETSIAASEPTPEAAANPVPEPGEAAKPVIGSLQKVKTTPEKLGKILANAYYIARAGDNKKSISQKVFGTDSRVKELCKVNAFNCSRKIKVGDKFYYNSPQRPTDETTIKSFYEDAGVQPEVYVTKSGDNIRKLGKQLLGHDRGWMELWATNEVESKGDLPEGTQLKYWPKSEVSAPSLAKAEGEGKAPEAQAAEAMPVDAAAAAAAPTELAATDAANMPANPEAAAAANNAAPPVPPVPQDMAANVPPPPPAPPAEGGGDLTPAPDQAQAAAAAAGTVEPPPPPPPPSNGGAVVGEEVAMGQDPNQTMALGVGAVLLLAAVALFISIRKRKQRRAIDFNTGTQTQID